MSLSGTIIIDKDNSNENSQPNIIALPSILITKRSELLNALLDGGQSVDIEGCYDTSLEMKCTTLTTKNIDVGNGNGLNTRVNTVMTSIANKIRARQALNPTEVGLLGATKIPVYKILNVASAMSDTVAASQADKYASIVAKDILFAYINNLLDMVMSSTAGSPFIESEEGKKYKKGVNEARRHVALMKSENFAELSRYVDMIRETQLYERMLVATMSPALAESLRYSSSLR